MKVSELAKQASVTVDTVRHYTRIGLLKPKRNPDNGYQIYDGVALRHLRFIQKARLLGFGLSEIQAIVHHEHSGTSPCPLVRDLMKRHLPRVHQQISELQAQVEQMERALTAWEDMPDGTPDGDTLCRLIEHWGNLEETKHG
jgi:DNA-binding transcriptional MerR regulator